MVDKASVNFAAAHKALQKSATANPEWFDRARDVLRRSDTGEVLLMQCVLEGLKEAFEAGRKGKALPPLKYVQSLADMQKGIPADEEVEPAPARREVRRAKPAAPTEDPYIKGIMERDNPAPAATKRVVRGAR